MIRNLLALLTCAALTVLGVSCVDLLDVDNFQGAADALCEELRQCFGDAFYVDCVAYNNERLGAASSAERAAFLRTFADSVCLESCLSARQCLDETPICATLPESCGQAEQCCGFTSGEGDCIGGNCCKPDGITCDGPSECCTGDCSTPVGEDETFCGGYVCSLTNAPCEEDVECCTERCVAGRCSDMCIADGGACTLNSDCCAGSECAFGDVPMVDENGAERGTCVAAGCVPHGLACETGKPCCAPGGFCVQGSVGPAVCNSDECLPASVPCDVELNECCGRCNPMTKTCADNCVTPFEPCKGNGDCCNGSCDPNLEQCSCSPPGLSCGENFECCNENCINGVCETDMCLPAGIGCAPGDDCCFGCDLNDGMGGSGELECCEAASCSHNVCVAGGPLLEVCGCAECMDTAVVSPDRCIMTVCEQLPHCCCHKWDRSCSDAARDMCGAICPQGDVDVGGIGVEMPMP